MIKTYVDLVNVFLFLVLEQYVRLETYLDDISLISSEAEIKLIGFFKELLSSIYVSLNEVLKNAYLLKDNHYENWKSDSLDDLKTDIDTILYVLPLLSSQLTTIINETSNFPKKRPPEEIYDFIDQLFPELAISNTNVTVSLWSFYNYGELDFKSYLKDKLAKVGAPLEALKSITPKYLLLYLAEIESLNPFSWAFLAHEIGHAIIEKPTSMKGKTTTLSEKVIKKYIRIQTLDTDVHKEIKLLKPWVTEIIADEIGLRILGPAYFCSFVCLALLYSKLLTPSPTHPPSWVRIELMYSSLKNINIDHVINPYEIASLLKEKGNSSEKIMYICKKSWYKIHDKICDELEKIDIHYSYDQKFYKSWCDKTGKELSNSLKGGIPVSSLIKYKGGLDIESLNKKINKLIDSKVQFTTSSSDNKTETKLAKSFLEITNNIKSVTSKPGEILCAGWIYKWELLKSFCKSFFEKDVQKSEPPFAQIDTVIDKKVKQFRLKIVNIDEMMKKSLENSFIQKFIQEEV